MSLPISTAAPCAAPSLYTLVSSYVEAEAAATGRRLSPWEALRALDAQADAARREAEDDGNLTVPPALLPAFDALLDLGYGGRAIRAALRELAGRGTAEGSTVVDPEHWARIEALLPRSPQWESPVWDIGRWVPADGPGQAVA